MPTHYTEYENQKVTVMKPVNEVRTAQVPTVSYQNVTTMQPVTRNAGYWQTRYKFNPKVSPCQYDNRPTLVGWMNRQGYAIRSAFTPRVSRKREFVPQQITTQVPVTRRVAQHGTRQVNYTVSRMQPVTETRKVAVQKVRYVSRVVTKTQPVTVMKNMLVAPRAVRTFFGTKTVMVPVAAPMSYSPQQKRTANSNDNKFSPNNTNAPEKGFKRQKSGGSSQIKQNYHPNNGATFQANQQASTVSTTNIAPAGTTQVYRSQSLPTVVRVHRNAVAATPQQGGPVFASPSISIMHD